jgi:hypothetical protein
VPAPSAEPVPVVGGTDTGAEAAGFTGTEALAEPGPEVLADPDAPPPQPGTAEPARTEPLALPGCPALAPPSPGTVARPLPDRVDAPGAEPEVAEPEAGAADPGEMTEALPEAGAAAEPDVDSEAEPEAPDAGFCPGWAAHKAPGAGGGGGAYPSWSLPAGGRAAGGVGPSLSDVACRSSMHPPDPGADGSDVGRCP